MGYNSTVVIFNDALDSIANDPEFGKKLAAAISQANCYNKPISISASHGTAAIVVETHHADYDVLVKVGENRGEVVNVNDICPNCGY